MAKIIFNYGVMNSGKSIELLKVVHNYKTQGKKALILTSGLDDRSGVGVVSSRVGLKETAIPVFADTDIFRLVSDKNLGTNYDCILVDEAQFLTKDSVLGLVKVADLLDIPVIAFGLKNDFCNEMFEGTKYLMIYADKINEIKTVCWYCTAKATMNLRLADGKAQYDGEQLQIGGNESYVPVCRNHYYHPKVK